MPDMDSPITRAEHEEFKARLNEENDRQNTRIRLLEENTKQLNALATSVEKLAGNMACMLKEQERQGKRLEALEGRDGEMWRRMAGYLATTAAGILLGFLFQQIGL